MVDTNKRFEEGSVKRLEKENVKYSEDIRETISENTKNEDHTYNRNSHNEEIKIIADKEKQRKGSINVENIMLEVNKRLGRKCENS